MSLYLASRAENGGIYRYDFDGEQYRQVGFFEMDSPMYMIANECAMHVLLRDPFHNKESGYVRYEITESGDLVSPSPILSTKGEIACHLFVEGRRVYCVNYTSGSVICLPDTLILHKGDSPSHTHYVGPTPDGKYLCVTDLGLDQIMLYDKDLHLWQTVSMPKGCGPRHLVFGDDNLVFCANELDATVSVLRYEEGDMKLLDTVSCVKPREGISGAPSAIRLHNGKIYVAVRGHNVISRLRFQQGKLELDESFDCGGEMPRDFCIDQNRLICCNQQSHTVTVLKEANGTLAPIQTIHLHEPICALTY